MKDAAISEIPGLVNKQVDLKNLAHTEPPPSETVKNSDLSVNSKTREKTHVTTHVSHKDLYTEPEFEQNTKPSSTDWENNDFQSEPKFNYNIEPTLNSLKFAMPKVRIENNYESPTYGLMELTRGICQANIKGTPEYLKHSEYLENQWREIADYKERFIRVYSSQIHSFRETYRRQEYFS